MSTSWARTLANRLFNNWQSDVNTANLATERDRNRALSAVDQYAGQDFTVPQSMIDRDTGTMLAELNRFRGYTPTLNYGATEANADKRANLATAQKLADNGTNQAMNDRSTMTGLIQQFNAKEADIPDRSSQDRATMLRQLASYAKNNVGLSAQDKAKILGDMKQQEDANNAAQITAIQQQAAQQGITMSPWMVAQIGARFALASQDRLDAKALELEQYDREAKNSAQQFYLSAMSDTLDSTRQSELAAAQLRESLAASNDQTALALFDSLLQNTRQDSLEAQTTGAQLGQQARSTAGSMIQNADQLREQLKASRDTAGLQLLDSVLAGARDETRQNEQTQMAQSSTAAQLLNQILSNTEYQTMDVGQMASLISMLAQRA